ncbi:MAG: YncE family protein [Phycisphaerae bacterium]|nr:YncE family protein [Phycisphaerae bacterium]
MRCHHLVVPVSCGALVSLAGAQWLGAPDLRSPDGDVPVHRFLSDSVLSPLAPRAGGSTRAVGTFVHVGANPEADAHSGAAMLPDGVSVVVSSRDSKNLVVFDTTTRALVKAIPLSGTPNGVAVTPDGSKAVTPNILEGTLSIVELVSGVEIAAVPAGTNPLIARLTPDGTKAVVQDNTTQSLYVVDMASASVVRTIPTGGRIVYSVSVNFETMATGSVAGGFELADNNTAIIADYFNDKILIADLSTGVVSSIVCPDQPRAIAVNAAGTRGVVTHTGATRKLSVVDVPGRAISASISTTADLWGPVTMNPTGTHAVIAIQNNCRVIDLSTGASSADLATASVDNLWTTAGGQYVLASGFRGSIISYASQSIVKETNNFVLCPHGAVSPVSSRAAMFSDAFGEDMVVVDTNGAAGSMLSAGPSGPAPEGDRCRTVAVSADGSRAVAVSQQSQTAALINTQTGSVIGWATTGRRPGGVAITPDGTKAVVANRDGTDATIISLPSMSVTNVPISFRGDEVEISPDGQFACIAVVTDDGVWRINLNTSTVQGAKLVTGNMGGVGYINSQFSGMTLSPDGQTLVTCNSFSNTISMIDTTSWSVVKTLAVGTFPTRATFSPDTSKVYIANRDSDTVSVVNNAGVGSTVTGTITAGDQPFEMGVSPDGARLYVSNFGSNNVRVVNTSTLATLATIAMPANQYIAGLRLTPDGTRLYVSTGNGSISISANYFWQTQSGAISIIDTATSTIVDSANTGRSIAMIDMSAAGNRLATAECWGDGVTLVARCRADFNADGFVNGNDYDEFAGLFDVADPGADFNGDGFVNGNDYDEFAAAFDEGC